MEITGGSGIFKGDIELADDRVDLGVDNFEFVVLAGGLTLRAEEAAVFGLPSFNNAELPAAIIDMSEGRGQPCFSASLSLEIAAGADLIRSGDSSETPTLLNADLCFSVIAGGEVRLKDFWLVPSSSGL